MALFASRENKKLKAKLNKAFSAISETSNFITSGQFLGFGSVSISWYKFQINLEILRIYDIVPQIQSILLNSGAKFSNMEWIHTRKGERVENSEIEAFLNRPNPLQAKAEFWQQYYVWLKLFGNAYILENKRHRSAEKYENGTLNLSSSWNMAPQYMTPIGTGKHYRQSKLDKIIKQYVYNPTNNIIRADKFEPDEILHTSDIYIDPQDGRWLEGRPRIISLHRPITNIAMAYEQRGVIQKNRGADFILSPDLKANELGIAALQAGQKEDAEKAYKDYGLLDGQNRIVFSPIPIKLLKTGMKIDDLMLFEEIKEDSRDLCNGFNYPFQLLFSEDSTFSNQNEQHRSHYRDSIIPDGQSLAKEIKRDFNMPDDEDLKASYDHLEILQEDKKISADTSQVRSETILAIQKSVFEGHTSEKSAVEILKSEFGYTDQQAVNILSFEGRKPPVTEQS